MHPSPESLPRRNGAMIHASPKLAVFGWRFRSVAGATYLNARQQEQFQNARAVIVCANGAETPRLLLLSASSKFPHGLANSSGLVGKYLMFNYGARVGAVFEHELNEFKSVQVTRILHDFYDSDPKRGFYGGGGIDARIGPQPRMWALRIAD